MWLSAALSLAGLGLTLRALEARFGRLSMDRFRGLYDHAPALAACFLLTGLGSVGFPGTLGFVAAELRIDAVIAANPAAGVAMVLAAAVNGIAVVRAYLPPLQGNPAHIERVAGDHAAGTNCRLDPRGVDPGRGSCAAAGGRLALSCCGDDARGSHDAAASLK